jgi:hypothetical protein
MKRCPTCGIELREEKHGSPHPGGGFVLCYRHPAGQCPLAEQLVSAHAEQQKHGEGKASLHYERKERHERR